MLKSLKIKNFRCFEEFDLPQLGRVNLLVGKNNSGKTSILEALHILNSTDSIQPFLDIIQCRGEYSLSEKEASKATFEVRHFFYSHQINNESYFEISGTNTNKNRIKFNFELSDVPIEQLKDNLLGKYVRSRFFSSDTILTSEPNYFLTWERIDGSKSLTWLPSGISTYRMTSDSEDEKNSKLVSLTSSDIHTVIEDFNEIVLTPQEEILYESLRIIEPGIDRIAPVATQWHRGFRNGGFVVSINKQRVPIGSMGYGIWRMLEITLAMVNIPGGTLLIDEIDTGLHFSVMIDLWKLICKTAEKLDIQVFATTHNSDCWKSLAEVANSDDIASDDITIHRIERGKKASIVFNEQEMAIAADRDIEVR
jgi:AAA15 family ATPase/GTPase